MSEMQISLNQLADFRGSTISKKNRIIAQQQNPDKFRIQWYQLPKARVKKSIELKGDLNPIFDAIMVLMSRKPTNTRQANDRQVSIEALERYLKMPLPKTLKEMDYVTVKAKEKSFVYSDVKIIVAPELIIKGKLNGKTVVGGVKIRLSKNNPLDLPKSKIIASTIFRYLNEKVVGENEVVLPGLCYSLDVFSQRMVSADTDFDWATEELDKLIDELRELWPAA